MEKKSQARDRGFLFYRRTLMLLRRGRRRARGPRTRGWTRGWDPAARALGLALALVLAKPADGQEPQVTRSEPPEVQVVLGRAAVELVVWGSGLDLVTAASVLDASGRALADTEVRIVERGRDWIRLSVTTGRRAPVGAAGAVELATRTERVATPARVVVQAPPFLPVTMETAGLRMTGIRFHPVTIHAGALVMTGIRFHPVTMETDGLVMTGILD
jgi:hypothetical protein